MEDVWKHINLIEFISDYDNIKAFSVDIFLHCKLENVHLKNNNLSNNELIYQTILRHYISDAGLTVTRRTERQYEMNGRNINLIEDVLILNGLEKDVEGFMEDLVGEFI